MSSNPLDKILRPRFPACAVGFEKDAIAVVQLERGRGGFAVKRAASVNLPADLVRPGFDEGNIGDPADLAAALLVLPRHAGEEQWLCNGSQGDGLLLTAHDEGFTAVLVRGGRALTLRSVFCEPAESDDELHRVLLFYRERSGDNGESAVDRLLIV